MAIDPTKRQSYATPRPVAPYPELLPMDDPNLSWERFEAFCEEFISRLPGVKETHRYGGQGSRQKGIDIFADLHTGERWAFQCKQRKRFTENHATKAIEQTSYKADRYILMLSRLAGTGVRDVCDNHASWDVWDVGDISRKVRELPMHSGARLVEVHFGPLWRQAFLGLQGLASFCAPSEFFHPFSTTSNLFNHTWELVGRSSHLHQAHEFVESTSRQVCVLVGRGGIGKSKILHEFSETFDKQHQGMSLWFAADGVPITQDGADYLPYEPCVLVVDDAHRRSDIPALLALSRQRRHVTKLLLTCRPQAVDHLRSQITHGGFDVQQVVFLSDVKELSREEVTELGRQALGPEFSAFAEQLAAATWDCPLVTVVGGQLVAKKAIAPELLERDDEFRNTVLTRFRDVLVGEVGNRIDTSLCGSLLDLIAAVQPIRLDNEQTLEGEAEFLGIDRPMLLRSLGALEEAAVLLRRGNTLRIVPDVLADHILHQASITFQGQPTGYADRVFSEFASLCPSEVLRNLSELDWRLRWSGAGAPELLSRIWQGIEQEFRETSNSGRCIILRILEEVGAYQPERTLQLVEYAVRNPATKPEDPEWSKVYEYTHSDVLWQLPTLLRRVSYTLDFLPRSCELLWELGRDDTRDLNPNPDHAMRVLADLSTYDIGKPLVVNQDILDFVEQSLESTGIHNHVHSLLDIIDPMLAKTGHSTHSEGHNLGIRPFVVREDSVKAIRERAVSLVVSCLSSDSLRVSLRALKSLENALREPVGIFEMKITDEDREQWRPEQLKILGHLAGLVQRSDEPLVHLRVREALWWHQKHGPSDIVREMADAVASSIPDSFGLWFTQELVNPFHIDDWQPDGKSEDDGYNLHQEQVEQKQQALVAEFLDRSGDAATAYGALSDRIRTIYDAEVRPEPQVFLGILGNSEPEIAAGLCDLIVDDPNGALAPYLHPLLANVRIWNGQRARSISERALNGNSNILCRSLAMSYRLQGWADKATAQDTESIRSLLNHTDLGVRILAAESLGALAQADPRAAIDLAKAVEIRGSGELAKALYRLFYGGWGVPFRELSASDLEVLLSKLEDVPDIDDFSINTFLVKASEINAKAVVGLLLSRVRKGRDRSTRYSALPSLGFQQPLAGLAASPDQESILREIRDALLEQGWSIGYWVPQLFREISSGFESTEGLKVLDEWVNSENVDKVKLAAHLVSGARPSFVFNHVTFVSNLLDHAYAASDDTYLTVSRSLAKSVLSGSRSGTPGQPMPQDVTIRDRASAIASTSDSDSPTSRFYDSIAKGADANIRDQLLRDEELFE